MSGTLTMINMGQLHPLAHQHHTSRRGNNLLLNSLAQHQQQEFQDTHTPPTQAHPNLFSANVPFARPQLLAVASNPTQTSSHDAHYELPGCRYVSYFVSMHYTISPHQQCVIITSDQ
jgi:hypothetical protein